MTDSHRKRRYSIGLTALTAIWGLLLTVFSVLPIQYFNKISLLTAEGLKWLLNLLFASSGSKDYHDLMIMIAEIALLMAGYAVLAGLFWYVFGGWSGRRRAPVISMGCTIALAAANLFLGMLLQNKPFRIIDFFLNILGGLTALAALSLFGYLLNRFPRILNRETISYVFFGVLSTLVNMMAYGVCYNTFGLHNLVSNAIAWVAAVLFAYAVNKLFVFQSHKDTAAEALREFGLFIGARLLSFGVNEAMMWLMVDVGHINGGFSKILANIIVLIMNYFFSKRIIFINSPNSD
mgnify:CR=1 FL=1